MADHQHKIATEDQERKTDSSSSSLCFKELHAPLSPLVSRRLSLTTFYRTTVERATSTSMWDDLVPLPIIFDQITRVAFLKSILLPSNPHYQSPRQHPSVKATIALHESGKIDGSRVLIMGGKLVSGEVS